MPIDMGPLTDGLNDMSNDLSDTSDSWEKIRKAIKALRKGLEKLYPYIEHMHKSHAHLYASYLHSASNRKTIPGNPHKCYFQAWPWWLGWEAMHRRDRDYNGLIYGYDFIIDPDDVNKPRYLTGVERSLVLLSRKTLPINYSDQPKGKIISVSTYLTSVGIPESTVPLEVHSKLAQELILKKKVNTAPGNGRSEIYGTTFLIDPNDPEKPEYLKDLEKDLDIIPPKKLLTWQQFQSEYRDYFVDELPKNYVDTSIFATPSSVIEPTDNSCDYVCTRLVGEWIKGIDIDGNGLIYGQDFFFPNSEVKKCRCLAEIETDVDWNPPNNILHLTYDEFLNTFPEGVTPDDRGDY